MSAIPTDEPAQDDTQQIQQQLQQQDPQLNPQPASAEPNRKREYILFFAVSVPDFCSAKAPSVRRACVACHTGKTRCSEVLPCQVGSVLLLFTWPFGSIRIQSCLKRGLGTSCAYPDPDAQEHHGHQTPGISYCLDHCNAFSHCLSFSHSIHQRSICTSTTNVCNSAST